MRTLSFFVVVLLSLSACQTMKAGSSSVSQKAGSPSVFLKPNTQPVSRSLEPMAEPARYVGAVAEYLRNGEPFEQTRFSLSDTEETWRNSDGCEWARPISGFAPSSRWSGCSGADGAREVSINGSIWPLQVGSVVSYDFKGTNVNGETWSGTRKCKVKEETRVTVPAGTFDTFHVVCEDPWRSRHWYVSPELGTVAALYWATHKRRSITYHFELVSWDPGGAN